MKARANLVLLVAGLAVAYGSYLGGARIMRDAKYHESLVPQRVVGINEEISRLGNTRVRDVNVSDLGETATRYGSLVNERSELYASDSRIETGLNYKLPENRTRGLMISFAAGGALFFSSAYDLFKSGLEKIKSKSK